MQQDNLLALQSSARAIRNPFGVDFHTKWDGQPVVLPGDGKWRSYVGPLADHITKHLYMKVTYQLHDKEVEKLRSQAQDRAARKFNLPAAIKNKVWVAITGENHPQFTGEDIAQPEADMDFSVLQKDMQELEKKAESANESVSVAPMLEQASNEALASIQVSDSDAAHAKGGYNMGGPVAKDNMPLNPIEEAPVNATEQEPPAPDPQPQETAPEQQEGNEEFGDLKELA